jgi:DNA polymerase V
MPVVGLIDGNSFYCAAECAFAPELRGIPLVVLSNNDGCAIARTTEAKALGVKMGEPWHLANRRAECKGVEWRSSNYPLYGDMSRHMYEVLAARVPQVEPYSIDEMFLNLTGMRNLPAFYQNLRDEVRRTAKIPTCVGIGPTKTVAKLANRIAKDDFTLCGVCDLRDATVRAVAYNEFPVSMVWGIGGKTVEKLNRQGIATIADFVALEPEQVRGLLTVTGARVQAELRGQSCLPLTLMPAPRQAIAVTRSFGHLVTGWNEIREAVASFATRAAEKLRSEGLEAGHLSVFAHTNPHNGDPWYSGSRAARIEPTADSLAMIGEAVRLLRALWRPDYKYFKAGVMLGDLFPARQQAGMFATRDGAKSARAMAALDAVNARFGRGTLRPAATGMFKAWAGRQSRHSPRYTTHAGEMLVAKAF